MSLPAIFNRIKAFFRSTKEDQSPTPFADYSLSNTAQRQSRHVQQPGAASNDNQPSFRSFSRIAAASPAVNDISTSRRGSNDSSPSSPFSPIRPSYQPQSPYKLSITSLWITPEAAMTIAHQVQGAHRVILNSFQAKILVSQPIHIAPGMPSHITNTYKPIRYKTNVNVVLQTEEERIAEEGRKAEKAFEELASRGRMSALLSFEERAYTPSCDKETLRNLCVRILEWGWSDEEAQHLLWLSGLAGVGKMAVVSRVAEEMKRVGLLGARFSFSRYNSQTDPGLVVPALAYQLALISPDFKRIVTQSLVKDPLIFYRNRRFQFKELVINPFLSLPSPPKTPLLIVLDGLDECNDRQAQREFVDMINHHIHTEGSRLRLRWLISSRPEPHLKITFSNPDYKANCLYEELEVESEASKDARRRLEWGFEEIRQRYPDRLTQDWPDKSAIRFIARRLSGHADGVSVILQYIGDEHHGDPSGQFDACLRLFEGTSGGLYPLYALDLLYTQILSNVPETLLPTTRHILGLLVYYESETLPALIHANFLEIHQVTFYQALECLRPVLFVPAISEADEKPIRIYRTSFTDYLKGQARSGKFALDEGASHLNVAMQGLRWLCHCRKGHSASGSQPPPILTWIPPNTITKSVLDVLRRFSFTRCWKACTLVPEGYQGVLMGGLDDFDFNLDYRKWWPHETHDFARFIRWLISVGAVETGLIVLDYWNTKRGVSKRTRKLSIWHQDADPEAFVGPFLEGEIWAPDTAVHLQLGRFKPLALSLHVGISVSPSFLPVITC
ncbi:hypothetical protein D9756_008784 [Leucocoprinus leucothites]|uniref:Nephrocystin 3-like N-terminal domain-containing protein n=1 Tax=Leucocoprinus leucothites TaxID=201217 RepID=A0A8H5CZP8_9AGAR|nr:hypothetical protein D9756_008784 [Leucoagaricus leucothites]